jgi:hypothetical protein
VRDENENHSPSVLYLQYVYSEDTTFEKLVQLKYYHLLRLGASHTLRAVILHQEIK